MEFFSCVPIAQMFEEAKGTTEGIKAETDEFSSSWYQDRNESEGKEMA